MIQDTTRPFFAILIRKHRFLGRVFYAHLLEMDTEKQTLTSIGRVLPDTFARYEYAFSDMEKQIVKRIDDYSDEQLFRLFKKNVRSLPEFFKLIETNQDVQDYLRSYIEKVMLRVFEVAAENRIPVYAKDDNFETIAAGERLEAIPEVAEPVFNYDLTENELRYRLTAVDSRTKEALDFANADLLCMNPCLVCIRGKIYKFTAVGGKKINPFLTKPYIAIPSSSIQKYMETFVLNSIYSQQVQTKGFEIKQKQPEKRVALALQESITGGWVLYLWLRYDDKEYLYGTKPKPEVFLEKKDGRYCFYRFAREQAWETAQAQMLQEIGLVSYANDTGFVPDTGLPNTLHHIVEWLSEHAAVLEERGIVIIQPEKQTVYYIDHSKLILKSDQQEDWFDIYGIVKLNGFEIPFLQLKSNILKRIREFILPDNRIFLIPEEWFTLYQSLFLLGKTVDDKLKVPRILFNLIAEADIQAPTASEMRRRFTEYRPDELILPAGLKATLRNYQLEGLLWLQVLDKNHMGGCLADDMGLGKTLQVLAFLQVLKEERKNPPTLILVPASLVHNWLREIERFTTGMRVYIHTGVQRTRDINLFKRYDLILSTYGTLRNDIEWLQNAVFNYIVLDESQVIKNPDSKSYQSVMLLHASGFLSLSGTPIENSLMDLWAQMNVLNRGMLGSRKVFREEFVIPIEKEGNQQRKAMLRKMIEPVLLRRKKKEVAKELPDKVEQVVYCEMTERQAESYEKEKNAIRVSIIKQVSKQGLNRSTITILQGLSRLRQLANHPAMIYDDSDGLDSGKFDEITRSIESVVVEGHKVLIFSSFVKHLSLVADYLEENRIGYTMLTGSTARRDEVVDRFQQDENIPVFLISIKAGGVGLNLTAADYVFILDPWWNPAIEDQAVSRAHRIGQDKNIFVYRFISVDTIEEKIIRLQERKALLAKDFTESANPLQILGEESLLELLS